MTELTPRTQAILDEAAGRIRAYARRTVESAVAIGQELCMCQAVLGQEEPFRSWVEREFGWSHTTAYNLMNIAKRGKRLLDANISISLDAMYLACRDSTSEHVRERIVGRAQRGERITRQAVAGMLECDNDREEHGDETAAIVAKLRDIDVVGEDPDEVAAGVERVLRPHLAQRARHLARWLYQLARSLEAAG